MPYKNPEDRSRREREKYREDLEGNRAKNNVRAARWRENNPDKHIAAVRAWEKKNPKKKRAYEKKRNGNPVRLKKMRAHKKMLRETQPAKVRSHKLKAAYGIDATQYNDMLERQGGGCAICGATRHDARSANLAVDHCHETGKVRGLLCGACNNGIGRFKHNPVLLENAIGYLRG